MPQHPPLCLKHTGAIQLKPCNMLYMRKAPRSRVHACTQQHDLVDAVVLEAVDNLVVKPAGSKRKACGLKQPLAVGGRLWGLRNLMTTSE